MIELFKGPLGAQILEAIDFEKFQKLTLEII